MIKKHLLDYGTRWVFLEIELGRDEGGGSGGVLLGDPRKPSPPPWSRRTSHGNCVQGCHTAAGPLPAMEGGLGSEASCLQAGSGPDPPMSIPPGQRLCKLKPGNHPVFSRDTLNVIFGKLEAWDKHSFSLKQQLGVFVVIFVSFCFPKVHFAQKLVLFIRRKKAVLGDFSS